MKPENVSGSRLETDKTNRTAIEDPLNQNNKSARLTTNKSQIHFDEKMIEPKLQEMVKSTFESEFNNLKVFIEQTIQL